MTRGFRFDKVWLRQGERPGGSSRHRFALALALSLAAHGATLIWPLPHREPHKFGAQTVTQLPLRATLLNQAPASPSVPEPAQLHFPTQEPATGFLLTSPESALQVAPIERDEDLLPEAIAPDSVDVEEAVEEPPPSAPVVADREASIGEAELEALRSTIQGQGRVRFRFTVTAAGRVEDLVVETTDIPPEVELALTRKLLATAFLPAYRAGASASSMFSLELEP